MLAAAGMSSCGADDVGVPADEAATATPDGTDTAGTVGDSGPAEPSGADAVDVKALDNTFIEEQVDVAVGTEVVWKNGGRNDHDIVPVADDESWGVGIEAFHP